MFLLGACSNEEPLNRTTSYEGTVINSQTNLPFAGVTIKVTDGSHIAVNTSTGTDGKFSFNINWAEITGDYIIEIGNTTTEIKSLQLTGVSQSEVNLGQITISPQVVPTITFDEITSDGTKITLRATIESDGYSAIYEAGFCYSTTEDPTLNDKVIDAAIVDNSIQAEVNEMSLEANKKYYFRPYSNNRVGTGYGIVRFIVSSNALPIVDWYYKTGNVGADYITDLVLHLKADGGCEVTDVGFCWNTSGNPTIEDNCKSIGGMKPGQTNGPWPVTISDLNPKTTYYVRPYAKNIRNAIGYGEIRVYTTY